MYSLCSKLICVLGIKVKLYTFDQVHRKKYLYLQYKITIVEIVIKCILI
jgi:hypothetical protein